MSDPKHDTGVIMALSQRLKKRRIPNALALKAKVDRGEPLNRFDENFLNRVRQDLRKSAALLERHPEYQHLITQLTELYTEINKQASDNEKLSD